MTLIRRCSALLLAMLLLASIPALTTTVAAAPAGPADDGPGLWMQVQSWLDGVLDRVLAADLGGFGGTGDDGMGLDPDGGGGGDDGSSSDPPPPDDGSTAGASTSGP